MQGGATSSGGGGDLCLLPEGCIANILSFTSPQDACRLSLVSSAFKNAADSDELWEKFLPPGYQSLISKWPSSSSFSSSSSSSICFSSKRQLYMRLCDNPVLINEGKRSFSLDKKSGKKCYMLFARDLMILWGDHPSYWRWNAVPEAGLAEVAELVSVCWLEIRGYISTLLLSPATLYAAYLVFKSAPGAYGFAYYPVEVAVGLAGGESQKHNVFLDAEKGKGRRPFTPRRSRSRVLGLSRYIPIIAGDPKYPEERGDGWLEMELGEFFNSGGGDRELEMSVAEVNAGNWKGGLVVRGIQIRPKIC